MEPYTRHLIFGGQPHGLNSACTVRRIKMSSSKGKQPKLSAFFLKKDPSTSGTGVAQGDHAGELSTVQSEEQDDKLKIHYQIQIQNSNSNSKSLYLRKYTDIC